MAIHKIAESVLSATTGTVTFDSIPSTYKDLWILVSARHTDTGQTVANMNLRFNSSTGSTNYRYVQGQASSGTTQGAVASATYAVLKDSINGSQGAAGIFATIIIHIPKYSFTSLSHKVGWYFAATEDTGTFTTVTNGHFAKDTGTISTIDLYPESVGTQVFAIGSSFRLYGTD